VAELGHIEVTTSYSALAYMYSLVTPTIEIDDQAHRRPWGTTTFDVAPGTHFVAVSYPWLFFSRCGRSSIVVDLAPGETKYVTYRPWLVRFIPGRIRARGALPEARVAKR
jgi:hypothetical protein